MKTKTHSRAFVLAALLLALSVSALQWDIPSRLLGQAGGSAVKAFPEAEGFGKNTVGGRGGRILEVTRLACDNSPGSLCWAANQPGPRTIVYRIGGTNDGGLAITEPYLTIAGQTAPGGGITLTGEVAILTNDVIIRHIRVRRARFTGCTTDGADGTCEPRNMVIYGNPAIPYGSIRNIILDHISTSWGSDDMMGASGGNIADVTIQNSIIAEGLNRWTMGQAGKGLGMLFHCGARRVSVYRNLFAHNAARTPQISAENYVYPQGVTSWFQNDGCPPAYQGEDAVFDVVNNVTYNWRDWAVYVHGKAMVNLVANYFKVGADLEPVDGSSRREVFFAHHDHPTIQTGRRLFLKDNYTSLSCQGVCSDQWTMVAGTVLPEEKSVSSIGVPAVLTLTAQQAFDSVLNDAGTTVPMRDSVDARVIQDTRNGTGRQINDQSDVGGWPSLAAGTPYPDADHDGMSDAWEQTFGLNPQSASDGNADNDNDGYTNVEEFLHNLANRKLLTLQFVSSPPPETASSQIVLTYRVESTVKVQTFSLQTGQNTLTIREKNAHGAESTLTTNVTRVAQTSGATSSQPTHGAASSQPTQTASSQPSSTSWIYHITELPNPTSSQAQSSSAFVPVGSESSRRKTLALSNTKEFPVSLFPLKHELQNWRERIHFAAAADPLSATQTLQSLGVFLGQNNDASNLDTYGKLNRAEAVTLMFRMFSIPESDAEISFRDVPKNAWYEAALRAGIDAEILKGYPNGTFRPEQKMTLIEMVKVIAILSGLATEADEARGAEWFHIYLSRTYYAGLLKGLPDVQVDAEIERGWVALILMNTLQYLTTQQE